MTCIKVNETLYPAVISGNMVDRDWDDRKSKSITLEKSYAEVLEMLPDNTPWSIVQEERVPLCGENGEIVLDDEGDAVFEEKTTEWDNSEYSMSGDITDHRDGTVTIKMGKPTDLEDAYEMLIGG